MAFLTSNSLQKLVVASRLLHSHSQGTFNERLARAVSLLFDRIYYSFELYDNSEPYSVVTDAPVQETNKQAILERTTELVPLENPMFIAAMNGATDPMRLSDFMTKRQFLRTNLYNDVLRHCGTFHQIGVPLQSPVFIGGMGLHRDKDFTDEDLVLTALFAPQLATAFETNKMIRKLAPDVEKAKPVDFGKLRQFGLSRRECEVICWMVDGKRDGEIGVILGISFRTVNQHVRAILGKLRVESRTAAVSMILQRGDFPISGL